MSNYPPPPPGYPPMMPYGSTAGAPMRPTAITTIAIIAIIWGSLGLLCSAGGLATTAIAANMNTPNDPLKSHAGLRAAMAAFTVIALILAIFQLAGGIGSLKLAGWARLALIVYAIGTIVLNVTDFTVKAAYLAPIVQAPECQRISLPCRICGRILGRVNHGAGSPGLADRHPLFHV
jgi:hypothetical protein